MIGLILVGWVFPLWAIAGLDPPGAPASPDFAQHVVGQRYLMMEPLHWPLLVARRLDAPDGSHIGFTDSLPLLVLIMKPFAGLLPRGFQSVTIWLAVAWLLQPVAAVFALRGTGETRVSSALAIAVIASAVPTFLVRMPHAALSGHFVILLMLGAYFRIVGRHRRIAVRALAVACVLLPTLLLVHPYLLFMAAVLLGSAPLTLLFRGDAFWKASAAAITGSVLVTVALIVLLGYTGPAGGVGFGLYSMNLLSPIWPHDSALLADGLVGKLDATGGQFEGEQYLGAGILLLIALAVVTSPGEIATALRRHGGLLVACLCLSLLAVSNRIYIGNFLLLSFPAPAFLNAIRASGRLFWPVAYTILVGCVGLTIRCSARLKTTALALAAFLQAIDAHSLIDRDKATLTQTLPFPFDVVTLRTLLSNRQHLTLLPPFPCNATVDGITALMQVIWVGSETGISTNTMYTARPSHPPYCDVQADARRALREGEVRVFLHGFETLAQLVPDAQSLCRPLGAITVCARRAVAP